MPKLPGLSPTSTPSVTSTEAVTSTADVLFQRRWSKYYNLLAYLMVAFGLISACLDVNLTWAMRILCLVLAVLWAGWYWIFVVNHPRWKGRNLALGVSCVFAIEIATVLSFIHPAFLLLMFCFYGLSFSIMPVRWAVGLVIVLSLSLMVRFIGFSGGLSNQSIPIIASFTISAFFSVMLGIYIDSIIHQNRERKLMIEELERTRSELAAAERQAGMLEERQRLAGEIHDTLAQGFTSIVMHLEVADQSLGSDMSSARLHLAQARDTARQSLGEARRVLWALKPELLERKSLPQALSEATNRWSAENGIPAELTLSGEIGSIPAALEVILLRAAQEALVNVLKHAHAHKVILTLSYMGDEVILDVQDDGKGFEPSNPVDGKGGFGLAAMRQRVEQLGGSLGVESAPGEGTTLTVSLPLESIPIETLHTKQMAEIASLPTVVESKSTQDDTNRKI